MDFNFRPSPLEPNLKSTFTKTTVPTAKRKYSFFQQKEY